MAEIFFDKFTGQTMEVEAIDGVPATEIPESAVSLSGLLHATEFKIQRGDYPPLDVKEWKPEDYITFGKWALHALEVNGEPRPITLTHVDRLKILGLGPPVDRFKDFTAFKWLIDAPISGDKTRFRGQFKDISLQELVDQAEDLAFRLGRRPRKNDYLAAARRGEMPSYNYIINIAGGIWQLNEYIGFPNYKQWEPADFVDFGVRFAEVNDMSLFTPLGFDILAKRGRAPWTRSVTLRCGNWPAYRQAVVDTIQKTAAERAERDKFYRQMITNGRLPASFAELDGDLLATAGRYRVVADCAPTMTDGRKIKLAIGTSKTLVPKLVRFNSALSPGQIEMSAISINAFDDIWPAPPNEYLRISAREVEQARAARAVAGRQERRKHRRTKF